MVSAGRNCSADVRTASSSVLPAGTSASMVVITRKAGKIISMPE
jgi:hypothetical protein